MKYLNFININYSIISLVIFFFIAPQGFCNNVIDIQNGIYLGDLSIYKTENRGLYTGNILGYRGIESNSGLGLNIYAWPLQMTDNIDSFSRIFESSKLVGLEFIWEPLYTKDSTFGLGIFYRIDHLLMNTDLFDWRTGIRFDIRISDSYFTPYPIIAIETGYWKNEGFFIGIKFDPFVAIVALGFGFVEIGKNMFSDNDHYSSSNNNNEENPNWDWMPTQPK